jgi:hypothetical protein
MVAAFDPQNNFGFRYLIIGIFIVIWFYKIPEIFRINSIDDLILVMFIYMMPIYGTILYISRADEIRQFTDTSYISTAIVASLAYLLRKKDLIKPFQQAIWYIGLVYIFIYIILLGELLQWSHGGFVNYFVENNIARITTRNYGGVEFPYIYLYSSTLMIIPLIISFNKVKKIKSLNFFYFSGIVLSLFLSGTRSHQLIAIFYLFLLFKKISPKFTITGAIIFGIIFGNEMLIILKEALSTNEGSNEYKLDMIPYYYEIFSDYKTIIFGQGFEAVSWDVNLRSIVSLDTGATKTEITYLEIIRVFGIPIAFIFFSAIIIKIFGSYKSNNIVQNQILILLLIDSLLNPHLYSTYGAIIFSYAFSYISLENKRLNRYNDCIELKNKVII